MIEELQLKVGANNLSSRRTSLQAELKVKDAHPKKSS